jgi:hypothetical protein
MELNAEFLENNEATGREKDRADLKLLRKGGAEPGP